MTDLSQMVTNYLLPPRVDVFLISDKNVVTEDALIVNQTTGEQEHIHPEYEKFKWTKNPQIGISSLIVSLLSQTFDGKKTVIAIFEDHTIKTILNVDREFIPNLSSKNQ